MKITKLKELKNLLFFTKESLRQFETNEDALNFNLKYWINKGKIILLKNGFYVLKENWEKEEDKASFLEYLANKLYEPSYLSCEYILSQFGLLSESVFGISSVSINPTKSFQTPLITFTYFSLSPKLFSGYTIKKFKNAFIFTASKPKALFDFLYLRFLRREVVDRKTIDELRINWENLKKQEFEEAQKFAAASTSRNVQELFNLIKKMYYA